MSTTSRAYRTWLLTVLVATYACGFVDRIIVAVVGPALIADLHLSDLEFGLLGGMAFAIFFSAFGLPVARLAERWNRTRIIATSVALWSAMTALSGAASSYWQLFVCRVGVGIGEAGGTPPAHSLLSDYYPPKQRASALAVYSIGVPIGATIGAVVGGYAAEHLGWRAAFVVVGAPGVLLSLLVWLTIREPERGLADGALAGATAPPLGDLLRHLRTTPTFLHVCAGCSLATLAASSTVLFAPSYFVRQFGMGMGDVGLLFGLMMGVAGTAGILASGFGADAAGRRDVRWYVWGPAAGALAAVPLYLVVYTRDTAGAAFSVMLFATFSASVYFSPAFGVVQNLVPPRMRASAAALMLLAMNVLGQGVGPTVMGWVSDLAAARAFSAGDYTSVCFTGLTNDVAAACAEASAAGVRYALTGVTVFFVWGALHFLLAGRTVVRDLQGRSS